MEQIREVCPENVEVVQITHDERKAANEANQEVEALVSTIRMRTTELESSYTKLGSLVLRIRDERYWLLLGFHSFGEYVKSLHTRLGLGRTQIYQMVSISQNLIPLLGEDTLAEIGKSKAIELRRVVTSTGRRPSEDLIKKAKDPDVTLDEIRELAFKEIHGTPPPAESYMHLGGFHVTPSERAEINQAIECAKGVDPAVPHDIPDPLQLKEVLLRFSREFFGTYGGQNAN
jgi:hypothetical protein